jgi:methylated-DNA-[protein]-cysteine S-methyltransferase
VRANPFAPDVPCHRVIAADLSIGGFAGQTEGAEIRRKIGLLRGEGVPLDAAGRLLDNRRLWRF